MAEGSVNNGTLFLIVICSSQLICLILQPDLKGRVMLPSVSTTLINFWDKTTALLLGEPLFLLVTEGSIGDVTFYVKLVLLSEIY